MPPKKKAAPKKGGGRRAAKPTKEETVEVSSGLSLLIGHNDPPSRDLVYHLETIAGLEAKVKSAQSKVTDAKKKAKEAGVDMNALALTKKALNMDTMDLASMLRQQVILFREKGLPVQLSLYEPQYGSVEERAAAEGWADGSAGRNMNISRWPEGSPGHVNYTRRYNDAQAQIILDGKNAGNKDAPDAS